MDDFGVLPDDTLYHMFSFLNHNDLMSLCFVSKQWEVSKKARSEKVWKRKYEDLVKQFSLSILDKDGVRRFKKEKTALGKYRILKIASYMNQPIVKCTIVGDGAVGKTCFIMSYVNYGFPDDYIPTVYDECEASVTYQKRVVKLKLVDTGGQEDYDKVRPLYYPGTDIFIIVFSLVDPDSLENVERKWFPEIKQHCPKIPFILMGSKQDLRDDVALLRGLCYDNEKPATTLREGEKKAKEIGAV